MRASISVEMTLPGIKEETRWSRWTRLYQADLIGIRLVGALLESSEASGVGSRDTAFTCHSDLGEGLIFIIWRGSSILFCSLQERPAVALGTFLNFFSCVPLCPLFNEISELLLGTYMDNCGIRPVSPPDCMRSDWLFLLIYQEIFIPPMPTFGLFGSSCLYTGTISLTDSTIPCQTQNSAEQDRHRRRWL